MNLNRLPIFWCRIYTLGLPQETKHRRRGEIESDVFDQAREEGSRVGESALLFVRGLPDDLSWRAAQIGLRDAFVQNAAIASAFGASVSGALWCISKAAGSGLYAVPGGVAASVAIFVVLVHFSRERDTMMTTEPAAGRESSWAGPVAAILLPVALLMVAALVPFTSDLQSDYAEGAEKIADNQVRWQVGYYVYALATGLAIVATASYAGRLSGHGATLVGAAVPPLFTLAACVVVLAGQGAIGLAAAVTDGSTGSAESYLAYASDDNPASLIAFIGGLVMALCLLALAIATWRARILPDRWRALSTAGFVISGIVFGLTSGWVVSTGAVLLPFATAAAFWPAALTDLSAVVHASRPRANMSPSRP